MKHVLLASGLLALGLMSSPGTAHAANANDPYGNVDKRNDAGNNTGDGQVDKLNSGQLNENHRGPVVMRQPSDRVQGDASGPPASGSR